MAAEPRSQMPLLAGLLGVLLLALWWQFGGGSAAPAAPAAAGRPAASAPRGRPPAAASTAELFARGVALARLSEDRPAPEESGRDPFRSGASSSTVTGTGPGASEAVPTPVAPSPVLPTVPVQPQGPPPPPPISVKFIGVVSRRDIGKVAVLSDGKNVYYGREGEIVDGRWRIVAIGEESLQIEYADGRGRQTVRLTG